MLHISRLVIILSILLSLNTFSDTLIGRMKVSNILENTIVNSNTCNLKVISYNIQRIYNKRFKVSKVIRLKTYNVIEISDKKTKKKYIYFTRISC